MVLQYMILYVHTRSVTYVQCIRHTYKGIRSKPAFAEGSSALIDTVCFLRVLQNLLLSQNQSAPCQLLAQELLIGMNNKKCNRMTTRPLHYGDISPANGKRQFAFEICRPSQATLVTTPPGGSLTLSFFSPYQLCTSISHSYC